MTMIDDMMGMMITMAMKSKVSGYPKRTKKYQNASKATDKYQHKQKMRWAE